MIFSASVGLIPATVISLIKGIEILPSVRTTTLGTDTEGSPKTEI